MYAFNWHLVLRYAGEEEAEEFICKLFEAMMDILTWIDCNVGKYDDKHGKKGGKEDDNKDRTTLRAGTLTTAR